jgi:hypothetical protein
VLPGPSDAGNVASVQMYDRQNLSVSQIASRGVGRPVVVGVGIGYCGRLEDVGRPVVVGVRVAKHRAGEITRGASTTDVSTRKFIAVSFHDATGGDPASYPSAQHPLPAGRSHSVRGA